jgi:hypothetical protein
MDRIVRRRRTIPRDQRTPQRSSDQRWSSKEDALRCAASEEIVVFGCHQRHSPQSSRPLAPRKVVATATDHASGGCRRCNRSRLGQTWPPLLAPRAVIAAASLTSRAATHRHCLGPSHAGVAWDRRSCLVPQEVVVDVRSPLAPHAVAAAARPETLIPRGLGYFYRRSDLIRLNRIERLVYASSSY